MSCHGRKVSLRPTMLVRVCRPSTTPAWKGPTLPMSAPEVILARTVPGWRIFWPVTPSMVLAGTVEAASVYDSVCGFGLVERRYSFLPKGVVLVPPPLTKVLMWFSLSELVLGVEPNELDVAGQRLDLGGVHAAHLVLSDNPLQDLDAVSCLGFHRRRRPAVVGRTCGVLPQERKDWRSVIRRLPRLVLVAGEAESESFDPAHLRCADLVALRKGLHEVLAVLLGGLALRGLERVDVGLDGRSVGHGDAVDEEGDPRPGVGDCTVARLVAGSLGLLLLLLGVGWDLRKWIAGSAGLLGHDLRCRGNRRLPLARLLGLCVRQVWCHGSLLGSIADDLLSDGLR